MSRVAFLIAGVALALGGCIRTVEEHELIVERIIDPAPEARALPRCLELPARGDVTGWHRAEGERIALPKSFAPEPGPLPPSVAQHGGRVWVDSAGRTFRRIDGHWGVSENPAACHAVVNDALMVIVVDSDGTGRWVDAWPVSRSGLPTPRYDAVGSSAEDQTLFLRILQTYRAPSDD
ncbi:MAG TPA: hypothetical protein VF039_05960 [Longimicrobiales bacterium]